MGEGFFYETVAPILGIGSASLEAISTLTSEINFYTRLIQMTDSPTERPLFAIRCVELCCDRCKEEGKQAECVHMLHLVPVWQSEERHRKLKILIKLQTVSRQWDLIMLVHVLIIPQTVNSHAYALTATNTTNL